MQYKLVWNLTLMIFRLFQSLSEFSQNYLYSQHSSTCHPLHILYCIYNLLDILLHILLAFKNGFMLPEIEEIISSPDSLTPHFPIFLWIFEYILLKLLLKTLRCWDFPTLYPFPFPSFSFPTLPVLSLLYTFFSHFFLFLEKVILSYLGGDSSLYH